MPFNPVATGTTTTSQISRGSLGQDNGRPRSPTCLAFLYFWYQQRQAATRQPPGGGPETTPPAHPPTSPFPPHPSSQRGGEEQGADKIKCKISIRLARGDFVLRRRAKVNKTATYLLNSARRGSNAATVATHTPMHT